MNVYFISVDREPYNIQTANLISEILDATKPKHSRSVLVIRSKAKTHVFAWDSREADWERIQA